MIFFYFSTFSYFIWGLIFVIFKYSWSNMSDIWDFGHFLDFEPQFFLTGGTRQNSAIADIDAMQKLFIVHLRADLCCDQTWRIQYGQYWKFSVIFLILTFIFSKWWNKPKFCPLQKRNIDAIPKLFILHLRADLCCSQVLRIQYGQESRIRSLEPILNLYYSRGHSVLTIILILTESLW